MLIVFARDKLLRRCHFAIASALISSRMLRNRRPKSTQARETIMITALGKEVFSTIEEVDRSEPHGSPHDDIQHDFCSPKGLLIASAKSIDMMALQFNGWRSS